MLSGKRSGLSSSDVPAAWVVLGALVAVGGWARLDGHDRASLWFDEVITLEEATRSSVEETIGAKTVHPPLIRVAARASLSVLGDWPELASKDLALRLPSVLMGTAAIVLIFLFGRTYAGDDDLVGLVAAGAWALLPYGIVYSREARFYAALVLFTAWTMYALALLHRHQRARDHIHLAVPLVFGAYTHYLFGFIFFLSALSVVPAIVLKPRRWTLTIPWLIAGLAFVPWVSFAAGSLQVEDRGWVGPLARHLRDVPVAFFTGRLGYYHLHLEARDGVLGGAVILIGLGLLIHLHRRRAGFARLTAVVLVPTLVIAALLHHSFVQTPFFHSKYLAGLYPFFCLALGELVTFAFGWLWRRHAPPVGDRAALAPLVLGVALGASVPVARALDQVYARMRTLQRQPYADAAAWIAQRRDEGELVVVLECSGAYNELALRHYGLAPPFASLRCRDQGRTALPVRAARTFALLTHWGRAATRDAALELLEAQYGPVAERVDLRGVDANAVVLMLDSR